MSKEFSEVYSPVETIKIGDRDYTVGKIAIGDIINFQNWCDREAKKELIDLYEMSGEKVDIKELRNLSADQDLYDKKSTSLEGVIFLFTSIVKRLNKNVDEDLIKSLLTVSDIEKISEVISEDIPEGEDNKANFTEKKKDKKTKS